jgi:hypothetical protein
MVLFDAFTQWLAGLTLKSPPVADSSAGPKAEPGKRAADSEKEWTPPISIDDSPAGYKIRWWS